jgi:hypothetical protein
MLDGIAGTDETAGYDGTAGDYETAGNYETAGYDETAGTGETEEAGNTIQVPRSRNFLHTHKLTTTTVTIYTATTRAYTIITSICYVKYL